jgi:hypothetical protein
MPEGDQDHGGISVPVAVRLGGLDQGLDIAGVRCSRSDAVPEQLFVESRLATPASDATLP